MLDKTNNPIKLKKANMPFFIENQNNELIIYHSITGFILLCSEMDHIEKAKSVEKNEIIYLDKENAE